MEEEEEEGEDLHMKMLGLWGGGWHFQSKNTNDPNKAQAVLKPCSQLVHINI